MAQEEELRRGGGGGNEEEGGKEGGEEGGEGGAGAGEEAGEEVEEELVFVSDGEVVTEVEGTEVASVPPAPHPRRPRPPSTPPPLHLLIKYGMVRPSSHDHDWQAAGHGAVRDGPPTIENEEIVSPAFSDPCWSSVAWGPRLRGTGGAHPARAKKLKLF